MRSRCILRGKTGDNVVLGARYATSQFTMGTSVSPLQCNVLYSNCFVFMLFAERCTLHLIFLSASCTSLLVVEKLILLSSN